MKYLFICYPKCSTCNKAKKYLDESNIDYELRDIKKDNPNKDELKEWIEKSGLPIKKFFNTSGTIYKTLNFPTVSTSKSVIISPENDWFSGTLKFFLIWLWISFKKQVSVVFFCCSQAKNCGTSSVVWAFEKLINKNINSVFKIDFFIENFLEFRR